MPSGTVPNFCLTAKLLLRSGHKTRDSIVRRSWNFEPVYDDLSKAGLKQKPDQLFAIVVNGFGLAGILLYITEMETAHEPRYSVLHGFRLQHLRNEQMTI